jgi:hypothetical protein
VSVPAQGAVYRGTILISETTGMMRQTLSYGLDRMFPIWNMTDRRRIKVVAGNPADPSPGGHYQYVPIQQPTANIGYAFSPAMANPNISVTVVDGMADSTINASYFQAVSQNSAGPPAPAATAYWASISHKAPTDLVLPTDVLPPFGSMGIRNLDTENTDEGVNVISCYVSPPLYGAATFRAIEGARSANVVCTYRKPNQQLTVDFGC